MTTSFRETLRLWCIYRLLKPNSSTYNFFEVSGHNLKSLRLEFSVWISETLGKGGMVFYQFFLLSPLQCPVMHYRNCKKLRVSLKK